MSIRDDIEKVDKKVKNVEQSIAWDMLQDAKKVNKRMFILIIVILCMWFSTIGYLIYVLNDTGTYTETTNQEVSDIETIGGNVVNNGDVYGEN